MEDCKVGFGSHLICNIIDKESGLSAYIVMDSAVNGHSCGEVLGSNMELAGLNAKFIENFIIEEIGKKISEIIQLSQKKNTSPLGIAEIEAEKKFSRIRAKSEQKILKSRLFNIALKAYKRNLIPKCLVKFYAPGYFRARLG